MPTPHPSTRRLLAAALACLATLPIRAEINSEGAVTPDPQTTTAATNLTVGLNADGQLMINDGDRVDARTLYVGQDTITTNPRFTGRIDLAGVGSVLAVDQNLLVGDPTDATGFVEVSDGAALQVGFNTTISGTATWYSELRVLDATASMGSLTIRGGEENRLVIGAGATVDVTDRVSLNPGWSYLQAGTLDFRGGVLNTGTVLGPVQLMQGAGTINATSWLLDQTVVADSLGELPTQFVYDDYIGQDITVNLDWTLSDGTFGAGMSGVGEVTYRPGESFETRDGYLGLMPGSDGTVTLGNSGTQWLVDEWLHVGYAGVGTLNLTDGAIAQAQRVYIGDKRQAQGTVNITGDSRLVILSDLILANEIDSQAMIRVTGPNAKLDSGPLTVGQKGDAAVIFEQGATATHASIDLGDEVVGSGRLVVQNSGTVLTAGRITVNDDGSGLLEVLDGGRIKLGTNGNLYLGKDSRSTARVLIDGPGSSVQAGRVIMYGYSDTSLSILNGGQLSAHYYVRLRQTNSVSDNPVIVEVRGAGSALTSDDRLDIGSAPVYVSDGAALSADTAYLGYADQSQTLVQIGALGAAAATFTIGDELILGRSSFTTNNQELHIVGDSTVTVGNELFFNTYGALTFTPVDATTPALHVLGDATMNGQLRLHIDGGYLPEDGALIPLIQVDGTLTGDFGGLTDGDMWDINFGVLSRFILNPDPDTDVAASFTHLATGDLDGSGVVDSDDLLIVFTNFGNTVQAGRWLLGDADNSGVIDAYDQLIVQSAIDAQGPPNGNIPEPGSLVLLGALLPMLRRRDR